jgi:hypothetical protein
LKHAGDKSVTMDAKKPLTITELAGESVSRILSLRCLVPTCVGIFDGAAR